MPPLLELPLPALVTNSAIRARSTSGVRLSWRAAWSMARSAAKLRRPRRAWAAAWPISCSAASTMRALSSVREALMRASSFLLSASTSVRNF